MPIVKQLIHQTDKSSQGGGGGGWCSIKKLFVKILQYLRKTPVLKPLLWRGWNKVKGLKAFNFIKKILQHRCFLENTAKFLITPDLKNICVRLLLKIIKKGFLGKPTSHIDHYIINMGGQMSKTGGNWLLTGPYFLRRKSVQVFFW